MSSTRRIIRYLISGVGTTLVNWVVYVMCVEWIHLSILVSNALAWVAAILFSFYTNRIYVFRSASDRWFHEFLRFVSGRMLTGLIEVFLPSVLISLGINQPLFGIAGFAAKLITTVIITILNYFVSKWFVFKAPD